MSKVGPVLDGITLGYKMLILTHLILLSLLFSQTKTSTFRTTALSIQLPLDATLQSHKANDSRTAEHRTHAKHLLSLHKTKRQNELPSLSDPLRRYRA